jgi:hypothetical protein
MTIIGLFQCAPWCLPTQNWLKNATNDISIQKFHNVARHYVKDTGLIYVLHFLAQFLTSIILDDQHEITNISSYTT